MSRLQTLLSVALLAGVATHANADLAYTFDSDAQGFTVNVPAGELSHEAGGYLRIKDLTGDTNVSLILPGSAVAGGWLSYVGGTLSFDARMESPIDSYWPEFGTITLSSTVGSLAVDVAVGDAPGLGWATYSVVLDAANWSTSPEVLASVLANLQQVDISMEAGNGPIELLHIDNVTLSTAVPEPGTWAMSLMGLMALGWAVRRRA
ncbi:MAG: laminin B domain-containing protein [Aquabacterium sp.]|uniref:laminin B domain-containing protein n=1 Tax=Aquabacterium sp. TaxID=1872578 RepID=UPI00271F4310|nr:laminin B domain-containing protein [Aquabacterium sp.]MDO9004767.1 laminin B domain-containing protein [Aquabacterium sp.]